MGAGNGPLPLAWRYPPRAVVSGTGAAVTIDGHDWTMGRLQCFSPFEGGFGFEGRLWLVSARTYEGLVFWPRIFIFPYLLYAGIPPRSDYIGFGEGFLTDNLLLRPSCLIVSGFTCCHDQVV